MNDEQNSGDHGKLLTALAKSMTKLRCLCNFTKDVILILCPD